MYHVNVKLIVKLGAAVYVSFHIPHSFTALVITDGVY